MCFDPIRHSTQISQSTRLGTSEKTSFMRKLFPTRDALNPYKFLDYKFTGQGE